MNHKTQLSRGDVLLIEDGDGNKLVKLEFEGASLKVDGDKTTSGYQGYGPYGNTRPKGKKKKKE